MVCLRQATLYVKYCILYAMKAVGFASSQIIITVNVYKLGEKAREKVFSLSLSLPIFVLYIIIYK
jgi:hypothetical protein